MDIVDRARGVLLGLACGDALGRPVEFKSAEAIATEHGEVTTMLGQGSHQQPAGTITDDTELALCIARSLVETGTFDPADIADRFLDWYHSGPFDIGLMTADALRQLNQGAAWEDAGRTVYEQRPEGQNAGNGSVMRCPPLALAYHDAPAALVDASRLSSRITHYDERCQDGCAVLNLTIANCLHGDPAPLSNALATLDELPSALQEALQSVPDDVAPDQLLTGGYVVTTLQTALYCGLTAASPREAIIEAVNMGGDTDTIGAIAGAVAGARHGPASLPDDWITALAGTDREELSELAQALVAWDSV